MRRDPRRWSTPFGRWAMGYGVTRLAGEVGVRPSTVYSWVRGERSPRFHERAVIRRISDGEITGAHIDAHRQTLARVRSSR